MKDETVIVTTLCLLTAKQLAEVDNADDRRLLGCKRGHSGASQHQTLHRFRALRVKVMRVKFVFVAQF